jgi:hypothetical protein
MHPQASIGTVLNVTDVTDVGDGRLVYAYNMTESGDFDVAVRAPPPSSTHLQGSPAPTHVALSTSSQPTAFVWIAVD